MCIFDNACSQICQVPGIRFAAIINKKGRKIAGGFNTKVIPFEKDEHKIEMLFMENTLDLSMRSEFDDSLGNVQAVVAYRDNINMITIPYQDNLMLLSIDPKLDIHKVIQIAHQCLRSEQIMEIAA